MTGRSVDEKGKSHKPAVASDPDNQRRVIELAQHLIAMAPTAIFVRAPSGTVGGTGPQSDR